MVLLIPLISGFALIFWNMFFFLFLLTSFSVVIFSFVYPAVVSNAVEANMAITKKSQCVTCDLSLCCLLPCRAAPPLQTSSVSLRFVRLKKDASPE